ncbi:MAG: hypothetical protein RL380_210 [Verrucomicrobiota bacterium]|jgi:hypothetical protein
MNLARQLCLNHDTREAVARCPQCAHFFCRECVAEHDDRLLCAACLRQLLKPAAPAARTATSLRRTLAFAGGLVLAWGAFYFTGRTLLKIPTKFHDGTVWVTRFWQE